MKHSSIDLYQQVTNRIIDALDAGTPPWHCPWSDRAGLPSNLATGKPYRGVNILMLSIEASLKGYGDSRWLTFKQAGLLGAKVRKGEHGVPIVFWKLREIGEATDRSDRTDKGDATDSPESPKVIPLLRAYTVFNAQQLDFLPDRFELRPSPAWQPIGEAEELLHYSGAVIRHGGNRAFYSPGQDMIQLPPPDWFENPDAYYAVALHELTHWTGHPRRLDRPLGRRQGIDAYAFEELVAEMGAAFLCAHCGLPPRLEHASYIDSWLDALRRDKRLVFVAAAAAQKAVDYVLGESLPVPAPGAEAVPLAQAA